MGRRTALILGIVLAAALGVRLVLAQSTPVAADDFPDATPPASTAAGAATEPLGDHPPVQATSPATAPELTGAPPAAAVPKVARTTARADEVGGADSPPAATSPTSDPFDTSEFSAPRSPVAQVKPSAPPTTATARATDDGLDPTTKPAADGGTGAAEAPPAATPGSTPKVEQPPLSDAGTPPPSPSPLDGLDPAPPGPVEEPPKKDGQVERAQAPLPGDSPTLPPADNPGTDPAKPASTAAAEGPSETPIDRLPLGRQAVGLSVDVQAPAVVNLNKEVPFKIVVRNTGQADAHGVVVNDRLPEGFRFLGSEPAIKPEGQALTWVLGTLAAGADKVLTVRVRMEKVGPWEHAATVSLRAGARSKTLVQEPKLKVEQVVKPSTVLKGRPVSFYITVDNPGDGPARNVTIQAQLSTGLKHEQGSHVEQTIPLIKPGEQIRLEPLVVDTIRGGEQTSKVVVRSDDVLQEVAPSVQTVVVTEPMLSLKLLGPPKRYTDTVAKYRLVIDNPGSATTRDVRVVATMPSEGTLIPSSTGSQYDPQYDRFKRRLLWTIPQLAPNSHAELTFDVRLGGIQIYKVAAEVRAEGGLFEKDTCNTDVTGMADVDIQVTERHRVLDVGEETDYIIKLKNRGSKEATHLLVRAKLSDNLSLVHTAGTEEGAKKNPEGFVVFPRIDRLAPNAELPLAIRVKAAKDGPATCEVLLTHDDIGSAPLIRSTLIHITEAADALRR